MIVAGIDLEGAQHGAVKDQGRVDVDQAGQDAILVDEFLTEHQLGHVHRVLGPTVVGDRTHQRFVTVFKVAVHHVVVALVDRQVNGLADGASRVVQPGRHVRQLDEIPEVLNGRIASALVQIVDKGRAVGGHQHGILAADHHTALRVSGVLGVAGGCAGLDDRSTEPGGEAHPGAVDLGPGVPEQVQHLGIIEEVDTYLGE